MTNRSKAHRRAGKLKRRLAAAGASRKTSETTSKTATETGPETTDTATTSSLTQQKGVSRVPDILKTLTGDLHIVGGVHESTTSIVLPDGRKFTMQAPGNESPPTTLPPPHPVSSVSWSPKNAPPEEDDDELAIPDFDSPTNHNPSPWYNLDNLVPVAASPSSFPLAFLPADIIHHMASLMPQESAAALALTSKAMYSIIGLKIFMAMDRQALWRLLLLLERDSDLVVACGHCLRLHSPFIQPGNSLGGTKSRPECCDKYSDTPFVMNPAMCRLLAKRYIRHKPYGNLITAAVRNSKCILSDFKCFTTRDMRFVDGNLLLRTQSFFAPLNINGDITGRSVFIFHHMLRSKLQLCRHHSWTSFCGLDLRNRDYTAFETDDRFATSHDTAHHEYYGRAEDHHPEACYRKGLVPRDVFKGALQPHLKCALLHPQPCRSNKACLEATGGPRQRVGRVQSCKKCWTDFSVSAQDVGGVGRVMVLTTWKDIGGLGPGGSAKWFSHHEVFPKNLDPFASLEPRKRKREGLIYKAWENPSPGLPSTTHSSSVESRDTPSLRHEATFGRRVHAFFTGAPNLETDNTFFCYLMEPSWNIF
ncbi:hypothetical protein B0T22DRAFT_214561 [Podospora appendiculata]|uniref:F-box domain-containing protein n=1 Tax=Podospora appendiculata TaxID=314037 RepID=A0AAE0X576_9PEZI|nr:hypothetical protein B0T22DRAFT_214561 [Podospora appendiculata]